MIINNEPNILETGFNLKITDNNKTLYEPFVNKNYLDKDALNFRYDSIEEFFSESITIAANTYNVLKEWEQINFLTIKVSNKHNTPPSFNLKLDNINGQVLNLNEFVHLQFSEGINKFYISNPTEESQQFDIVYIKSNYKGTKVLNNYYKKSDTLLFWNIKHNLGKKPNYIFIGLNGKLLSPSYVTRIEDDNQIFFTFDEPYKGYIYFYNNFNYEQPLYKDTWEIEHNQDSMPNILVLDTNGAPITDYEITYFNTNKIILTFQNPRAGKALLY